MGQVSATNAWFEINAKDKKFRRKRGKIVFVAEKLLIDTRYLQHYNFVNVSVMLRDPRNGKTVSVSESELTHNWVDVTDE